MSSVPSTNSQCATATVGGVYEAAWKFERKGSVRGGRPGAHSSGGGSAGIQDCREFGTIRPDLQRFGETEGIGEQVRAPASVFVRGLWARSFQCRCRVPCATEQSAPRVCGSSRGSRSTRALRKADGGYCRGLRSHDCGCAAESCETDDCISSSLRSRKPGSDSPCPERETR